MEIHYNITNQTRDKSFLLTIPMILKVLIEIKLNKNKENENVAQLFYEIFRLYARRYSFLCI